MQGANIYGNKQKHSSGNSPSQVKVLQRAPRRNGITALPEERVIFFQNLLQRYR